MSSCKERSIEEEVERAVDKTACGEVIILHVPHNELMYRGFQVACHKYMMRICGCAKIQPKVCARANSRCIFVSSNLKTSVVYLPPPIYNAE